MNSFQWIKKIYRNSLTRKIRRVLFHLFNFFYLPLLYHSCNSRLRKLPKETQIFLMTRGDFGTILVLLNYVHCWEEKRGKTCLVVLTYHQEAASRLAQIICPNTEIVSPGKIGLFALKTFREDIVHFQTFSRVYARLAVDYPNALYIYSQGSSPRTKADFSPYIPFFDRALDCVDPSTPKYFINSYIKTRYILDYNQDIYLDMVRLHYTTELSKPRVFAPHLLDQLKEKMSLRGSYVVLNISCRDNMLSHNRKRIFQTEKFNRSIEYLINLGYTVVIQGRKEQPLFAKRKGLIDYSRSVYCSPENDLLLYSGCSFAIMSKSGPENFGTLCNIPILGVDYVEFPSMQPNLKMRFFPKHMRNSKTGRYIPWKEWLKEPFYFDIGENKLNPAIEYVGMNADELLAAVKEFVLLLNKSPAEWENYTPLQSSFKKELTPLHVDLFHIKGVPCDAYLASSKFA